MIQHTKTENANHLGRHILATLPDSISERKRLLLETVSLLPACPVRDDANLLLRLLTEHESHQLKFALAQ